MVLQSKHPIRTSRDTFNRKPFLVIYVKEREREGWGEVSWITGLSRDEPFSIEAVTCQLMERWCREGDVDSVLKEPVLKQYPGIGAGIQMALHSLAADHPLEWFPSDFLQGRRSIPINGLIWMDTFEHMEQAVAQRLEDGFTTIKIKVGAADFESEMRFLKRLREKYGYEFTLRLDANGAFPINLALLYLEQLAALDVHSIEQPIAPGQLEAMADLVRHTPIPIALDEELVKASDLQMMKTIVSTVRPHYVVLKPTLLGGVDIAFELLQHARSMGSDGWVTSALESNLGLAYIAQWTATLQPKMPQGLGTGGLFERNFALPLKVSNGQLRWRPPTPSPRQVIFLNL